MGGAKGIAAGDFHSCAILMDDTIACWGKNTFGQLGDGTTADNSSPSAVIGLVNATSAISAGSSHTCTQLSNASVACWGNGADGALGNGDFYQHTSPVVINKGTLPDTVQVSAGSRHTCGVSVTGRVYCWGENSYGALGNGNTMKSNVPVEVTGW
jgi:hypothetical protein